jgi:hypothetical protein
MDQTTPPVDNSAFTNRRRENRLPSHIPSLLIQHGRTVYTTVVNLSSKGIGFLSAVEVPSDEEVVITFERLDANTMVPVNLKVHVHTCQEVDFEYYIGGSIASKSLDYKKFFETIEAAEEPHE